MAIIEFDLLELDFDARDRQYFIDEVLTDCEKSNIAQDFFNNNPESVFKWISDDNGYSKEDFEKIYGKDNVIRLYNTLKNYYNES